MTKNEATRIAANFQRGFLDSDIRTAPLVLAYEPDRNNPEWMFVARVPNPSFGHAVYDSRPRGGGYVTDRITHRETQIYVSEQRRQVWAPGWDASESF